MKLLLLFLNLVCKPFGAFARIFYAYNQSVTILSTKNKVALGVESSALTEAKFSGAVAGAIAEVRCPDTHDQESSIITPDDATRVINLVFGEKPNSVGLFTADGHRLALVELKPSDFECLKRFYYSFKWGGPLKSHTFGLSPVRTWL